MEFDFVIIVISSYLLWSCHAIKFSTIFSFFLHRIPFLEILPLALQVRLIKSHFEEIAFIIYA
jgi:hypothetical protein